MTKKFKRPTLISTKSISSPSKRNKTALANQPTLRVIFTKDLIIGEKRGTEGRRGADPEFPIKKGDLTTKTALAINFPNTVARITKVAREAIA